MGFHPAQGLEFTNISNPFFAHVCAPVIPVIVGFSLLFRQALNSHPLCTHRTNDFRF